MVYSYTITLDQIISIEEELVNSIKVKKLSDTSDAQELRIGLIAQTIDRNKFDNERLMDQLVKSITSILTTGSSYNAKTHTS